MLGYNHEWRLISPVTTVDELFALTKEKGCLEPMSCRIRLLASRWRLHPTTSIIFSILFSGASGYVLAFWMVTGYIWLAFISMVVTWRCFISHSIVLPWHVSA